MPDPTENPVVSAPKGAPPRDTGGDTTSAATAGQKLLQSANGDQSAPIKTTDQSQPAPASPDTRTLWVGEFLDARMRPAAQSDSNPTPENIAKGFADLEQHLKRSGMPTAHVDEVSKEFESLRKQGKLPQELSAIKSVVDRLNKDARNDTLTHESANTMMRLVSASLEGKVKLITPETAPTVAERPVYNRENPDYRKADPKQPGESGDTNCRACTGSFILNEQLSDRAMLSEYAKVLDHLDEGGGKKLLVPIENGIPKMTADAFELNHGATHTGSPGTVYTAKQQEAFRKLNPPVATYIQNGLKEAGLSNVSLPGGANKSFREPGMYVLEHPTTGEGRVNGHVTAAYVGQDGRLQRHDTQIPDNRNANWEISSAYRVTFGDEALEEKGSRFNSATNKIESSTRIKNPDGTIRDINFSKQDGQPQSLTDVDGRSYFRNPEGKWQTIKQGIAVDAPFKNVEYLGTADGTRFTFEGYTVTEKPNGTADISVPDRIVKNEGTALKLNGSDAKISDLVSKITRNVDGSFSVQFKDNSKRIIKSDAENAKASDVRNIQQLDAQLNGLGDGQRSGTTGGESLNRAIMTRIQEETAKGASLDSAVLTLLKPNASGADLERMSQISEVMRKAGIPADPSTLAKVDKIMADLRLTTDEIGKAKTVLEKAEQHLKNEKAPVTEKQALEIAILQNTQDPAKPGKTFSEPSARSRLKKVEEIRVETRQSELPLSTALEVMRLIEQYPDTISDSFSKSQTQGSAALVKGNRIRLAYNLAKDPATLAQTEATFKELGGSASGLRLADAAALNTFPELKNNPQLALDAYTRALNIRSELMAPANRYGAADYIGMGLLQQEQEKSGIAKKSTQLETDYLSARAKAAKAKDEAPTRVLPEAAATAEKPAEIATATDTTATPPKAEAVQPLADTYRGFREKIASLDNLPANEMRDECFRTALRETAFSVTSRRHRPAFAGTPAVVVESDHLQPGESKLTITHKGQPLEVKSLDSAAGPLQFVTADGTRVIIQECQIAMQCGKNSTKEQVAREALVRSNELKALFEGKTADSADRVAANQAIRTAFNHGATQDRAGQGVAERVATLGAFELQAGREPVLLSNTGVKFGGKPEVTFETLVKETWKDKREHLERLERSRGSAENKALDGQIKILKDQIADLDHLSKNVHRPETMAKLMEAIKKHATTEEIERLRAEHAAGRGGHFKGAVTKAGTYSLVAAFVAQMICREGQQQETSTGYAPTTTGG